MKRSRLARKGSDTTLNFSILKKRARLMNFFCINTVVGKDGITVIEPWDRSCLENFKQKYGVKTYDQAIAISNKNIEKQFGLKLEHVGKDYSSSGRMVATLSRFVIKK